MGTIHPDQNPSLCMSSTSLNTVNIFLTVSQLSPNPRYGPILEIIVRIPLIQIFALLMALGTLSFELPAPFMKGTVFQRNFTFKAVFLLIQATLAILFYQVSDFSTCLPTMSVFKINHLLIFPLVLRGRMLPFGRSSPLLPMYVLSWWMKSSTNPKSPPAEVEEAQQRERDPSVSRRIASFICCVALR